MNKFSVAEKINSEVNNSVKYKSDFNHYGTIERWTLPSDGYGDCEDYALLKRMMLLEAGFNSEDLLLAVCKDETGSGHCALFCNTENGGFILDNKREYPEVPSKLPYTDWKIFRRGEWWSISGWR